MRSHAVEALARDGIYAACDSTALAGEETDAARTAARAMSEDECAAAQSDCAAAHRLASGLAQMINEQAAEEDSGDDEYYNGGYGYGEDSEEEPDGPSLRIDRDFKLGRTLDYQNSPPPRRGNVNRDPALLRNILTTSSWLIPPVRSKRCSRRRTRAEAADGDVRGRRRDHGALGARRRAGDADGGA